MKKIIFENTKIIAIATILSLAVGVASAWTAPTQPAPNGNIAAPVNVGSLGQIKSGGLSVYTLISDNGLIVSNGNVGIGVTNPTKKLEVNGDIKVNGIYSSSGKYSLVCGALGAGGCCRIDTQTGQTECKYYGDVATGQEAYNCTLRTGCSYRTTYETVWTKLPSPFTINTPSYNGRYDLSSDSGLCRVDTQTGQTECKVYGDVVTGQESYNCTLRTGCSYRNVYTTMWTQLPPPF